MEHKCILCTITKPLTEFYRHPKMANGYLGRCKECHKNEINRKRLGNIEEYRLRSKMSNRKTCAGLTQQEKDVKNAKSRAWRAINGRGRAHSKVDYALRCGEMVRPSKCDWCDSTQPIKGHHDDYSKPLEVMWLCSICHAKRHKELKSAN